MSPLEDHKSHQMRLVQFAKQIQLKMCQYLLNIDKINVLK